jgi:LemA protein
LRPPARARKIGIFLNHRSGYGRVIIGRSEEIPAMPQIIVRLDRLARLAAMMAVAMLLSACGVNNIPTYEEQARARWSDVESQFQRRADLIPNLVETVRGFAAQEREVLREVVEARAKATQVQLPADVLTNPDAFKKFQDAQSELSGALARLLVTVERYPDLKSNQNFLALQSQLEGTENRIAVARRDYIDAVRLYNTELKTIPGVIWKRLLYADRQEMQQFAAAPGTEAVPKVNFGN